jgi:hypothetical protein
MQRGANEKGRNASIGAQSDNFLFGVPVSTLVATLSYSTPHAAPEQTVAIQQPNGETVSCHPGHLA